MADFPTPFDQSPEYQTPILTNQVNDTNMEPSPKVFYRTPRNWLILIFIIIPFVNGIAISCSMYYEISNNDEDNTPLFICLFPLIFSLVGIIIGCVFPFYFTITIDNYLGIIIIRSRKFCLCCNRPNTIEIKNIEQALVEIDPNTNIRVFGTKIDAFKLTFKLFDGRKIKAFSGVIDYKGASVKVANILRISLPKNIQIIEN